MANETMLERPHLPMDEPEAGFVDAADDAPVNGAEPAEHGPYYEHWSSVIGAFKDDPAFDEMMRIIRQRRREMDADDSIA